MLKKLLLSTAVVVGLAVGAGSANSASAHWPHHHHWHNGPYLAGPPIVLRGSYYPVQYYYPRYWGPYDYGYGPYFGSGVRFSVGF